MPSDGAGDWPGDVGVEAAVAEGGTDGDVGTVGTDVCAGRTGAADASGVGTGVGGGTELYTGACCGATRGQNSGTSKSTCEAAERSVAREWSPGN